MLDRLDPRALAAALLGPGPRDRGRPGGLSQAGVRPYRARRAGVSVIYDPATKTLRTDGVNAVPLTAC